MSSIGTGRSRGRRAGGRRGRRPCATSATVTSVRIPSARSGARPGWVGSSPGWTTSASARAGGWVRDASADGGQSPRAGCRAVRWPRQALRRARCRAVRWPRRASRRARCRAVRRRAAGVAASAVPSGPRRGRGAAWRGAASAAGPHERRRLEPHEVDGGREDRARDRGRVLERGQARHVAQHPLRGRLGGRPAERGDLVAQLGRRAADPVEIVGAQRPGEPDLEHPDDAAVGADREARLADGRRGVVAAARVLGHDRLDVRGERRADGARGGRDPHSPGPVPRAGHTPQTSTALEPDARQQARVRREAVGDRLTDGADPRAGTPQCHPLNWSIRDHLRGRAYRQMSDPT